MYRIFLSLLVALLILIGQQHPAEAADDLTAIGAKRQLMLDQVAGEVLNRLSLEEKIGQLFIVAANDNSAHITDLIKSFHVGGFIFFSAHTGSIEETMRQIELIRSASRIAPFIAVDQEGGRVARLSFVTKTPQTSLLSALSPSSLFNIGGLLGHELHSLGFNLNFAPVMDVATRTDNPAIRERSFGNDPYQVAFLGRAFINGLQNSGVAAVAKHFPGHGDTATDSHYELPVVSHSSDRLDAVEILPFRAAVQTDVAMIMMAHVHYPSLDSTRDWPASLSRPIVTDLLRTELQYRGVIITDAMNMKSVTRLLPSGPAALAAVKAGADIILMPVNLPEAFHTVLSAVRTGSIPISQIDESLRRILRVKFQYSSRTPQAPFQARLNYALETVGSPQHNKWMSRFLHDQQIRTNSFPWQKNQ